MASEILRKNKGKRKRMDKPRCPKRYLDKGCGARDPAASGQQLGTEQHHR